MDATAESQEEWGAELESWIAPVVFRRSHDLGLKADDQLRAFQAARVRVWQVMRRWRADGGASRKTWACRHASYAVADFAKSLSPPIGRAQAADEHVIDPTASDPFAFVAKQELLQGLRDCIRLLRQPQRRRIELTLGSVQRTLRQLAEHDGVSLDTFRKSVADARVQLRVCLEGKGLNPLEHLG